MSRLFTDPRLPFYRLNFVVAAVDVAAFDADRGRRARIAMQFSSASILP
jgi:hypothetical protein